MQRGDRVLVHAAGGGVGHFAVQLAKHLGAYVIGTSRASGHDWLRSIGADEVIDYSTVRFEDGLADVDTVIDLVGDEHDATSTRSVTVLRPDGILVAIPGGVSPELAAAAESAGVRTSPFLVEPDGAALARIGALIDAGDLIVEVEKVFDLADAAQAHTRAESGRTRGKLVLRVAS